MQFTFGVKFDLETDAGVFVPWMKYLKPMMELVEVFQVKVYSIESVPNNLGQEVQKRGRKKTISQPEAIQTLDSYWVKSKIL